MNSFEYLLGMLLDVPVRARDAARRHWPTTRRLRTLAEAPPARAAREAELARIRALVEGLGAVEGVEHVLTQVSDHCDRPHAFEFFTRPHDSVLVCRITAMAYFVIREDIRDVLPRIEAAGLTTWGASYGEAGTVGHALRWYRDGGLTPEGWRMDSPQLLSADGYLSWDRPGLLCPDPPGQRLRSGVRLHNTRTPEGDPAALLREARANGRGVVLELELRREWRKSGNYHVVGRGGFAGRGRLRA